MQHTFSQVGEVIAIGFMGLSSTLQKTDLFTAVGAYADRAGQVVGEILLLGGLLVLNPGY